MSHEKPNEKWWIIPIVLMALILALSVKIVFFTIQAPTITEPELNTKTCATWVKSWGSITVDVKDLKLYSKTMAINGAPDFVVSCNAE